MTTIKLAIIVSLSAGFAACPDDPVNPPDEIEPDSTVHQYSWEIDTLGTWQSRAWRVWGTTENDVFVAGTFFNPDAQTAGTNVMHWNGQEWKPLPFWVGDLATVFGFSENDVWVAGDRVVDPYSYPIWGHWNGQTWEQMTLTEYGGIRGLWGRSSQDLYAVGGYGLIYHYDGTSWSMMNSSTSVDLWDVWGTPDGAVYAAGYVDSNATGVLLRLSSGAWETVYQRLWNDPVKPSGNTTTVWGYDSTHMFIYASSGLYEGSADSWTRLYPPIENIRMHLIRGSSAKNIFSTGGFGLIVHWNGKSWHRYDEFFRYPGGDNLFAVWAFQGSVFIVGRSEDARGIVYRGVQ